MEKIANSWWMYLLGVIVVLFVLTGSLYFIIKSYKDAKELNMDPKVLRKTIINSAVFTILPSISILIGVVTLSGILGIPLPWIRLTVIGALHYEGVAANAAYEGIKSISELSAQQFVTIAFVMTLGILSGPLYCLFGFKSYDKKILSKAKNNDDNQIEEQENKEEKTEKPKKKSFGDVLFNAVFIAMICSFLAVDGANLFKNYRVQVNNGSNEYISEVYELDSPFKDAESIIWSSSDESIATVEEIFNDDNESIGKVTIKGKGTVTITAKHGDETETFELKLNTKTYMPLIVILVTFGSMFVLDVIQRKLHWKWLASFDLGLSMLIGMAVAVLIG